MDTVKLLFGIYQYGRYGGDRKSEGHNVHVKKRVHLGFPHYTVQTLTYLTLSQFSLLRIYEWVKCDEKDRPMDGVLYKQREMFKIVMVF